MIRFRDIDVLNKKDTAHFMNDSVKFYENFTKNLLHLQFIIFIFRRMMTISFT